MTHDRRTQLDLEASVTGGRVLGVREGNLFAWRGIPYAAPPVGPLRFRAPQAVLPWQDVRDGAQYGSIASQVSRQPQLGMQLARRHPQSSEDCLTVNVLSPALARPSDGLLPVIVFIHGGGYSVGSSRDFFGQGNGFARTGRVIYVSFNYRLGALGYLDFTRYSTPDRPIESNLGLRDQVAGLRWVRDNARAFGGDPANVTVMGESAGGNAVTTLMATPSARGLFARAIAQSAPPNAVYGPELTAEWAEQFVGILRGGSSGDALDVLTNATPLQLVQACVTLQVETPDRYPGTFCLAHVVDGRFLPERPMIAFRSGQAHRVPLIIGTNDREGSIFRGRIDILPRTPSRIRSVFERAPEASRAPMLRAYAGLPARRPAADFGGDYGFWYPSSRVADFHSRYAPVHFYRFDLATRFLRFVGLDATHGSEMFGLFDTMDSPLARTMTALGGREEYTGAGARMRAYWLRFAADGTVGVSWPGYTDRERKTLIIDVVDRVEDDPRAGRRVAWDAFLPELGVDAGSRGLLRGLRRRLSSFAESGLMHLPGRKEGP